MEIIFKTLVDYIYNNRLAIDKGTYLTIVIGQITIYAILLTFYQFIVSYRGTNDRSVLKYLGINVIEYFVNKRLVIYNRVISKPLFGLLFVLEILYKPIISIYGNVIPKNIITVFNFIWYVYVVFFFVVFVVLLFQCVGCILSVNAVSDSKRNLYIIRCMNKDLKKRTLADLLTKNSLDMLVNDMNKLSRIIVEDSDSELQVAYGNLVTDIFDNYIQRKKKGIELLSKKNRKSKKQRPWENIMNRECMVLTKFVKGNNIRVYHLVENYILDFHLRLLKLNLQRALMDGYEKIAIGTSDFNKDSIDCKKWEDLTEEIFKKCSREDKQKMVETLHRGCLSNNSLFEEYCEKALLSIIQDPIWEILEGTEQQKDFVDIIKYVIHDDKYNDLYINKICEHIIYSNNINLANLIKLVNKKNCTYIFAYLVMYYSIYNDELKNINIPMLKELIRNGESLENEFKRIDRMILNSRISHRYYSDMYRAMLENLGEQITGKWLENIYRQKKIDAFYITIIKLCVFDQPYSPFYQEGGIEAKISFINDLAKHKEVLAFDNVKNMFLKMQYTDFRELGYWPKKIDITLRVLLLTNIGISDEMLDDKIQYLHYTSVGQYLLVIYAEKNNIGEVIKDLIRKAYVASNMPIQEYVDHLYNECSICGITLSYVKREKMKRYLAEVIWE